MSDDDDKYGDSRANCKYGANCYQKNAQHRARFKHPQKRKHDVVTTSNEDEESKHDPKQPLADIGLTKKHRKTVDKNGNSEVKKSPDERQRSDDTSSSSRLPVDSPSNVADGESCSGGESENELDSSPIDLKESVQQKFLMEMPDDFYSFWEFCKSIGPFKPQEALKGRLGLKLVGPYDVLSGKLKKLEMRRPSLYLRHWRFYYDPPEFQTVLVGNLETQFHMGYFRDDPSEMPFFVASNTVSEGCSFKVVAPNIFAAVNDFMTTELKKKRKEAQLLQSLQTKLQKWAKKEDITLETRTAEMKARDKKAVARGFHKLGLVVPYDKKTEVGYRPLPINDVNLRKMLQKIADSKTDFERTKNLDALQEIITLVQFANDECDYGMGFELGMNMFSFGEPSLHTTTSFLLCTAYDLLGRQPFAKILQAHLKDRKKAGDLSVTT